MSKKKTGGGSDVSSKNGRGKSGGGFFQNLASETIQGVSAIVFFVLAIFASLAIWNKAGVAGHYAFLSLSYLLGVGYYLLPLILIVLGITFLRNRHRNFDSAKLYGSVIFFIGTLGTIDIVSPTSGGKIGVWIAYPLIKLFEETASLVFLAALVVISVLIAFNREMDLKSLFRLNKEENTERDGDEDEEDDVDVKLSVPFEEEQKKDREKKTDEKLKKESVIMENKQNLYLKKI